MKTLRSTVEAEFSLLMLLSFIPNFALPATFLSLLIFSTVDHSCFELKLTVKERSFRLARVLPYEKMGSLFLRSSTNILLLEAEKSILFLLVLILMSSS